MSVSHVPSAGRFVGQSVSRKEDLRLVTGKGRFVDDITVKGMLHAAFLRSDVARGNVTRIDTTAAKALPGVRLVLTGADLNPHAGLMIPSMFVDGLFGPVGPTRPLAGDDVRFVGDPIALVIADSRYIAEDAVDLIEVDIDPLDPIVDYETAAGITDLVHPEQGTNISMFMEVPAPEGAAEAWSSAATVVRESYYQHRYSTVPMETRGVVASFDKHQQMLDVWISSQNPHEVRLAVSRTTGLSENKVRVRSGDVGGGFGQKSFAGREELAVILAATLHGIAIKWIEDRREDLIAGYHARQARADVGFAFDEEGHILAASMAHLEDVGAYTLGGGASGPMACMHFPGPYRVPFLDFASTVVWTNTCGRAAYRAPWQMESVAREQMLDHCARAMGMDPLELRRRNVLQPSDLPYMNPAGVEVINVSPAESLDAAAAAIGYDGFRAEQAAARASGAAAESGKVQGIGICLYIEPSPAQMVAYANEPVNIRVHPDGHVDVFLGSGAHGQGLETTTAQLCAEYLGVNFEDVTVHQGDTESTPFGPGTGGSRSGPMIGATVLQAASGLKEKILTIAANQLEAAVEDLAIEGGVISVAGTPSKSTTIADVANLAYHHSYMLPEGMSAGLEVVNRYMAPPAIWSNACHIAIVEVDTITGFVEVLRYVVAEDCGKMINPMIVEGQIAGGVVQGLGGVLFEENLYDDIGTPMATTFMDYLLPGSTEVPDVEYVHIETPAATLGGFKGCGEGGAIGAPPAIFNAVSDALAHLGAHFTRQPLSPARITDALAAAN
ncbi:MAG: xanthine dehydrogenase family protein molybdopterin-binding subunit [Acidimicrobiia bacterium]